MDPAALKSRATAAFKSFAPAQLAVMGLLAAALLVGGMTFMKWAATPSYGVLFSGLEAKDAQSVVDKLKTQGVSYKLVSDGTAIMVPSSKVYDLRLSLSADGLPKGSVVGYEILNNQGLTTSEFSQQVNYQRAVEGELTRTLSAMKGIDSVSIHLAIPRDELFTDNTTKPSAAVLLKTAGTMGDDAVDSIVHLVASSVPGMTAENVTVADTNGNVLSNGAGGGTGSTKELRRTQQYEAQLAANATAMLQQVYGAGHAVVRVSARMNYDTKQTQTETYDPASQVALSEDTSQETFKGTDGSGSSSASGTLGTTTGTSGSSGTGSTDYQKAESSKDFGVNKVTENATVAPGKVERLSVAVMLDKAAKPAPDATQVKDLVGAALGIDSSRGDNIVVDTTSFSKDAAGVATLVGGARPASPMLDYARTGIGVLILAVVVFVLLRGMRKTKVEIVDLPGGLRPMLAAGTGGAGGGGSYDAMALGAGVHDRDGRELVAVGASTQQQVLSLVDQQPDEVAVLLRSWLGDQRVSLVALSAENRKKAATLLVAVGPERAATLMKSFDEDEMRRLASEVAQIGTLPKEEVAHILQEVAEEVVSRRMAAAGGVRDAHDLLSRALGDERAARLMEIIEGERAGQPFHYLATAAPDLVARALTGEAPASAALALAFLPAETAAKIIGKMSPSVAAEMARRLASLEFAHPDVIAEVNAEFEQRLAPLLDQTTEEIPGLQRLVDMLNLASCDTERELLQGIEATDPELAARIREALFVFDDVARLDDRAIQQVLKGVDSKDLAVALKNAGSEVTETIMRNLSERARTNLQEEIEFLKNIRGSDIQEARSKIVKQVRTLEEDGTIVIQRGGSDDLA